MFDLPRVFKEVIPEYSPNNKWKEISFANGGIPSTLQDIKVAPHSCGYAFKEFPNRFIYWKTNYDVLEIVEQSLDFNLSNNQIRYKFQNTPILDGITVYERANTIVLLVPTVSSVHRLTFPRPIYERPCDFRTTSIFSEITSDSVLDPTTYHLFNTMPYLPHSAASLLADDDDNAVFSLALNNNSVLLIKLQRLTGMATTHYLNTESSGRKRFLSGLTEVLLRSKSSDDSTVSLALEKHQKDVYLFALSSNGQLRVYCLKKMSCIYEFDFASTNQALTGAQYHILRKKLSGSHLTLAVYSSSLEYSRMMVLRPFLKKDKISFDNEPLTYATPANMDLIEMNVDCEGSVILCLWRSREYGDTTVSALSLTSGKWSSFEKHGKELSEDHLHSSRAGLTSREFYLNLIFAPGAFSVSDIRKVLNIYKGTPQLEYSSEKQDLRSKVCTALEMDIQTEALEYELSDEDYIDISERCWNKFYVNCIQYQETGKIPNSLFWLASSSLLVVISKNNLSFYRNVDLLEEALLQPQYSHESQSYKHVLSILSKMHLNEEQDLRFDRSLKGFSSIKEVSADIAAEFKLQNKLNLELDAVMKYQDLQLTLRNLSDVLFMPETFEHTGDYCDSFRSELGIQLIFSSISQIVKIRLLTCRNFALLIQILDSSEIKKDFLFDTLNLCQAYAILNWCCETIVPNDKRLISLMQLILNKPDIIFQTMILDSVWSTLQYLWPLTNSRYLAEFLLFNKQHLLLTNFSRMVNHKSWSNLLIQNFIETNEPYKAFDLSREVIDSPEDCLKVIKLFESADQSDIVIQLAELAVDKAIKIQHPDLATLHSILFLHHLKLGHYDLAFLNMEKNSEFSRRVDCLRELVITLMNSKDVEKLLNFPYNDLLPYLENIIEQRARSLQPVQAAPYYNFLYALYVRLDNYRKAARIMFEQGFRSDDNKQQMVCYSVASNCLSLVSPDHAWLLKPNPTKENTIEDNEEMLDIYQLSDLVKEFELASARFKLLNCPPDVSAHEVVMKLISASRYKLALRISSLFNLKLEPALEALAAACTRITEDPDPWSWLVENDISDFIIGDENAAVVAWRLLEALLLKYEKPRQTTLHKAITCKIMSLDVILPFWLEVSYKKRNPGELLRLYLKYGELTEASKLCCALIAALLGKGKEDFGIEDSVGIISSAKCLPTRAIDVLLAELECHQMNDLHEEVKSMVDIYLSTMQRITNDRIRYSGNDEIAVPSYAS